MYIKKIHISTYIKHVLNHALSYFNYLVQKIAKKLHIFCKNRMKGGMNKINIYTTSTPIIKS
jgi:hypothetical protein